MVVQRRVRFGQDLEIAGVAMIKREARATRQVPSAHVHFSRSNRVEGRSICGESGQCTGFVSLGRRALCSRYGDRWYYDERRRTSEFQYMLTTIYYGTEYLAIGAVL